MKRLLLLCLLVPTLHGMETKGTGYISELEQEFTLKAQRLSLLQDINELENLLTTLQENIQLTQELMQLKGAGKELATKLRTYNQEKRITQGNLAQKQRELKNIERRIAQVQGQVETSFE